MTTFSALAIKLGQHGVKHLRQTCPISPSMRSMTRLMTNGTTSFTCIKILSSSLSTSCVQSVTPVRDLTHGRHVLILDASRQMNKFEHHLREICHHRQEKRGRSSSADEAVFENLDALVTDILRATRERDVMADSLSRDAVKTLVECLQMQGFFYKKIRKLLSRRLWLLKQPDQMTDITELLLQHGFSHTAVCHLIEAIPHHLQNSMDELPNVINGTMSVFGSQGISGKDVISILRQSPSVLYTDLNTFLKAVSVLKSMFSAKDVGKLLRKSPTILAESKSDIYKKYEYAIYNMVYTNDNIANSSFLSHSFEHIRNRHLFLVRSGLFVTVSHKLDQALNPNPTLNDVVDTSNSDFLDLFPVTDLEGLTNFCEMRAVEVEIEAEEVDEFSDDNGDDDDEADASSRNEINQEKRHSRSKTFMGKKHDKYR